MKILIGADVDPLLPDPLHRKPTGDIWEPLARISQLSRALGSALPPITWLIRSDESIRFATGDYASGYSRHEELWSGLVQRGHELGFHMHLMSFDEARGAFTFDPRPPWLEAAHAALAQRFPVRATRTGWTFANSFLIRELDRLGVELDFSALPGSMAWLAVGGSTVTVDWRRCGSEPYRPDRDDYQRTGANPLGLIEVPVAQFRNTSPDVLKRLVWRLLHRSASLAGLFSKTRMITEAWAELPRRTDGVWAFYFHPADLTLDGIRNFADNLARLRALPEVEFLTASAVRRWCVPRLA